MVYILDQTQRELDGQALAHPAVAKLAAYDEGHGTALLENARYFMESKYNVSRTAQRLHVCRSSLLARLDRIESVAGIDWNDWNERVHLALSFCLASARQEVSS